MAGVSGGQTRRIGSMAWALAGARPRVIRKWKGGKYWASQSFLGEDSGGTVDLGAWVESARKGQRGKWFW